jgi:hypothetical protein
MEITDTYRRYVRDSVHLKKKYWYMRMEWPARKARSKNDVKYKEHMTNRAAVLDGAYESTDTYKSG